MLAFFQRISRFLADHTAPFVILVGAAAYFYPPLCRWVKGNSQTVILGVIMLTMGMTLTTEDFRTLAKRPLDIFIGACAQYTLMPLLAWILVHTFKLPKGVAVGLLLVGTCPGGVSSNIMSFLAKGDVAFSVGMTTASTLLSPVMTPLLMAFLAGETIEVNTWGMFKSILIVTLLPVTAGALLNLAFGKRRGYGETMKLMPAAGAIGLALIVGGIMSVHGDKFFSSGVMIFLVVFVHNTLGYLSGYLVGACTGMNAAKRRTISIEVGCQNAGLGTNLATIHFPLLPEAALAAAVACVYHSVSGTVLANCFALYDRIKAKRDAKK